MGRSKTLLMSVLVAAFFFAASFIHVQKSAQAEIFFREVDVWNKSVSTGADVLTTDLRTTTRGSGTTGGGIATTRQSSVTYRFLIAIAPTATASVFYLRITDVTSSMAEDFAINGGTALTAGNAYTFDFNASSSFRYNFRVGTDTVIGILSVDRKED